MALENNAICAICGKPYRVCHTCNDIVSFNPWRTVTDTLPHYMIYLILVDYTKNKDKIAAKKELEKCDLSGLSNFDKDIKNVIDEIMSVETISPVTKSTKKTTINKVGNKNDNIE